MTDIEIVIDGKKLKVLPNQSIIEVADQAGIYIPRFCYHKHLSVAANCRMCLVEVEKAPKPMPACATPVAPNMVVMTRSSKALAAQRAVMEFLLINHPLDCPICDQGGECELQDLAMGYGDSKSHFDECKRAFPDLELGPLISTEMTRCIQCTRCVRFGQEVAGIAELGTTQRGGHMEISTYVAHAMQSEVSGNIIDLCPVGALTSKPYRFTARAWEIDQAPSISLHDGFGTNTHVHTREGTVMRVVPREAPALNQTWISDRDRFSYTALNHPDRLLSPMIKKGDTWCDVSWEEAITQAVALLQNQVEQAGGASLSGLVSAQSSVEELYLFQKLMRGLGCAHIDHRVDEQDFRDQATMPLYPGFSSTLGDFKEADAVILIGARLDHELPMLALSLRQMIKTGTKVLRLSAVLDDMHMPIAAEAHASSAEWVSTLRKLLSILESGARHAQDAAYLEWRDVLKDAKRVHIILGQQALSHPDASWLRYYASLMASHLSAHLHLLGTSGNASGAWLAGAVLHRGPGGKSLGDRSSHTKAAVFSEAFGGHVLLNIEPSMTALPRVAESALRKARVIIALSTFKDPILLEHAQVMLPIAPYTETSGTYVNLWGEWQSVCGVAKGMGHSRPAWKVLRVLGELLDVPGFQYDSSETVLQEVKQHVAHLEALNARPAFPVPSDQPRLSDGELVCFKETLSYQADALLRRSEPLQVALQNMCGKMAHQEVRVHPDTASASSLNHGDRIALHQNDCVIEAKLAVDIRVAKNTCWISQGDLASQGAYHGACKLTRVTSVGSTGNLEQ